MTDITNIYSKMWRDCIHKFENNSCEIDPLINDAEDTRRGLTVLSYFDQGLSENISQFINELKDIEPQQYYYPASDFHATILSIISCISGFKLSDIEQQPYIDVFKEALQDMDPVKINLKGITVSSSCILIQGFPDGKQLEKLRNALRTGFIKAKLHVTIDSRYKISTAHTTVVRCLTPFKNSEKVMRILTKYKDHDFGTLEVNTLDFVFNNWYQNASVTKILSRQPLKATAENDT